MSKAIYMGISSSWKNTKDLYIGVGTSWKQVKEAYIGIGGSWKQCYPSTKAPTISVVLVSNFTYDGSSHSLVSSYKYNGSATLARFQFASVYSSSTTKPSTPSSYGSSVPTGTNAGYYHVFYYCPAYGDYTEVYGYAGYVQIYKATPVITSMTVNNTQYTGSAQNMISSYTTNAPTSSIYLGISTSSSSFDGTWVNNPSCTEAALKKTSVGTYYVWFYAASSGNFNSQSAIYTGYSVAIAEGYASLTVTLKKDGANIMAISRPTVYMTSTTTVVPSTIYLSTSSTTNTNTYNDSHYATGTEFENVVPRTYYIWLGSSVASSAYGASITLTANASSSVQFNFYTLTLSKGTGISSVSGGGVYASGVKASVSCSASSGYQFTKWTYTSSGSSYSTNSSFTYTVTSQQGFTANAKEVPSYGSVSVDIYHNTSGTYLSTTQYVYGRRNSSSTTTSSSKVSLVWLSTSSESNTASYSVSYKGDKVTFNNVEYTGSGRTYYIFYGSSTSSDLYSGKYVTLNSSSTSQTVYCYTLKLTKGTGISSVSTNSGQVYAYNSPVTIFASVSSGYTWSKWTYTSTGSTYSTTNERTFSITSAMSLTANATASQTITFKTSYADSGTYSAGSTITLYQDDMSSNTLCVQFCVNGTATTPTSWSVTVTSGLSYSTSGSTCTVTNVFNSNPPQKVTIKATYSGTTYQIVFNIEE